MPHGDCLENTLYAFILVTLSLYVCHTYLSIYCINVRDHSKNPNRASTYLNLLVGSYWVSCARSTTFSHLLANWADMGRPSSGWCVFFFARTIIKHSCWISSLVVFLNSIYFGFCHPERQVPSLTSLNHLPLSGFMVYFSGTPQNLDVLDDKTMDASLPWPQSLGFVWK